MALAVRRSNHSARSHPQTRLDLIHVDEAFKVDELLFCITLCPWFAAGFYLVLFTLLPGTWWSLTQDRADKDPSPFFVGSGSGFFTILFPNLNPDSLLILSFRENWLEKLFKNHRYKNFLYFFCGLEWVGHSFAYFAHFVFLRDIWIRTQRAAVASRRATTLPTHVPCSMLKIWRDPDSVHLSTANKSEKLHSHWTSH